MHMVSTDARAVGAHLSTWGHAAHTRRLVALLAALSVSLPGCAQMGVSTQSARLGADDGTDSCRRQLVALDSTGNFFAEDILKGAAIGAVGGAALGGLLGGNWQSVAIGAAAGAVAGGTAGYWTDLQQQSQDQAAISARVQSDLVRENAQIDRTQVAFDQLTDCRFRQAAAIREGYRSGHVDLATAQSEMAVVRGRAQHDLALARAIDDKMHDRAGQFDVAAGNLDPAAPGVVATAAAHAPRRAVVRRSVPIRISPAPDSPEMAQLQPKQPVTVTGTRGDYAVVETASGARGYAPLSDLQPQGGGRIAPGPGASSSGGGGAGGQAVASLAGSNAARRDGFSQSVAVSEQAASSGFEIAG